MGVIYAARNIVNDKYYIGFTTKTLEIRRRQHYNEARNGSTTHFHKALRKYEEDSFEWKTIDKHEDPEVLKILERLHISRYESYDEGYNITMGGDGCVGLFGQKNPMYGKHHSEETKKKISEARMGWKHSEESKKKIGENNYSKPPEGREAARKRWTGAGNPMKNPELRERASKNSPMKRVEARKEMSYRQRGKGLFGFSGVRVNKGKNLEGNCWESRINYNSKQKHLGSFPDPLTGEIVYKLVWNEIYRFC